MNSSRLGGRPLAPWVVVWAVGFNAALAVSLARQHVGIAILAAAVPIVVVLIGKLAGPARAVLVFAAFVLPITQHALNAPYPFGGIAVWAPDVVVLLAVAGWFASRTRDDDAGPRSALRRSPLLGVPIILFGVCVLTATVRGHSLYGQSLVGQPTRLVLYGAIAAAFANLSVRDAYRGIVAVMYGGTVWMMLNAAYYLATGTSQTDQINLSTGGLRVLSSTVGLYLAAALFLALINLQLETSARRRALHLAIAALATFGVMLSYTRAVFVGVAVIVPLLLLLRRIRGPLVSMLPLALPFVLILGLFVSKAMPTVIPTFVDRITAPPSADSNVKWRQSASASIWAQVHESPWIGVGFGRTTTFTVEDVSQSGLVIPREQSATQDAHNGYLWLLAGGGVVTLGSFGLLLLAYAYDIWRRLRSTRDPTARALLTWSAATLVSFLLISLSSPVLSSPPTLLGIWVLLLLPSVVRLEERPTPPRALRA